MRAARSVLRIARAPVRPGYNLLTGRCKRLRKEKLTFTPSVPGQNLNFLVPFGFLIMMKTPTLLRGLRLHRAALWFLLLLPLLGRAQTPTAYPLSGGNYSEGFGDIANWVPIGTTFSGIGAQY